MGRQDRPKESEIGSGKRCVIYARCSTRDQDTENQLAQLRDYATRQQWIVVGEVVDVCSGGKDAKDRPGLDRAFTMAHRREFDLLLFWALDRFSREGMRHADIRETLVYASSVTALLARLMALGKRGTSVGIANYGRADAGTGWASREAARMGRASVHQPRSGTSCASTARIMTER